MTLPASAASDASRPDGLRAVDCHAHVFTRDLPLTAQHRHAPAHDALVGDYLALLDGAGLRRGVLVQPSFLGTDNRYLLQALAQHPDRLRGVAVLDPSISEAELAALDAQGVVGARLNLVGLELPALASPLWQGFFARLRALDWHVELHREARDLPTLLAPVLAGGCRVVVDHFGRPDAALGAADPGFEALLRLADSGQIWVKLSAAYRNAQASRLPAAQRTPALCAADAARAQACAEDLLAAFGPERLVWGSDWPHTQHADLIDYAASRAVLDEWVPHASQRRRILCNTPAELFHFS